MSNDYKCDVCIVGLGPAGFGAALTFSTYGFTSPVLCLDVGSHLDRRDCSFLQNGFCTKEEPCSMICGVGGSSLLSGHKISMFPAGSKIGSVIGSKDLARNNLSKALEVLSDYLALKTPNISQRDVAFAKDLFQNKGYEYRYYDAYICSTADLRTAYERILSQLHNKGFIISPNSEVVEVCSENGLFRLAVRQESRLVRVISKYLVLGVGRFGYNFLKLLNRKMSLGGEDNHLEIGVRLEFPTEILPDIDKYHKDLKLIDNDIRTFCVCKGGKIAPYILDGMFILDGYYDPTKETNFTNLAIMLRLKPSGRNSRIFKEIKKRILHVSNGKPVRQVLSQYLNAHDENKNTPAAKEPFFWIEADVNKCFPTQLAKELREGVLKFVSATFPKNDWAKVSVLAPTIEYNSLSFPIKPDFSVMPKMYFIGDCTGQFRGILQAFCSGIICAESIIRDING